MAMNEYVGEDLAALDAALAFIDEWDLDDVGGGLGELYVSADITASENTIASSCDAIVHDANPSASKLLETLEPAPLVSRVTTAATATAIKRNGASAPAPLDECPFGALVSAAMRGVAVAPVKSEVSAQRSPPPPPPSSSTSLSAASSQRSAWRNAPLSADVCPIAVDTKPREKKKRRDDSLAQDPRALALQSVNLRVKRRRQKEELLELRQKVQQLETRLTQIKTNSPRPESNASAAAASASQSTPGTWVAPSRAVIQHRSPLGVVWERLAARQQKERERAEEENQKLKEMLDEHVKLARSLDRILRKRATAQRLSPDGMVITGQSDATGDARHRDISHVNTLVIDLEGLYSDIDAISRRFGLTEQLATPFRDTKLRKDERTRGAFLESMDSRVLPFDMRSTGATVWQFLADESGGLARIYYQNCTNMTEDIRTCTYGIEMQHKETKAAFWGTSAMRKYVENGRIVISWSGQFEPVNRSATGGDASGLSGFVFHHKGWVDITPLMATPTEAVVMQSYYRIEPELADASGVDDPDAKISALMDFVISTTDARLDASHQFIENNLMKDLLRK